MLLTVCYITLTFIVNYCAIWSHPDKLILVDLITILFKIFKSCKPGKFSFTKQKKSENSNSSKNDDGDDFYSKYEEEKKKPPSKGIFSSNGYKLSDDV